MIWPAEPCPRKFLFERDTFAFANELLWEYRIDAATGTTTTVRNAPTPDYAHRCFVLVRSARQFLYHARFEPAQAALAAPAYRPLIRQVVTRDPRRPSAEGQKVVIPGYDCLRSFSQAQAPLLKAACGGAWQSYVLRSHWRMILPISRPHQARTARQLLAAFKEKPDPIVHLVRFPQLTINHGITLIEAAKSASGLRFTAYDPNVPTHPSELLYEEAEQTFYFPRNHYWAGGRVDVIEIYRGWFY
jgi:hypothetical protein